MTFDERVGARLADLLSARKMKQVDLVNAGIAKSSHISHIIKGTSRPSFTNLIQICDILGVSLSEFFDPIDNYSNGLISRFSDFVCLSDNDLDLLKSIAHRLSSSQQVELNSCTPSPSSSVNNLVSVPEHDPYIPLVGDAAAGPQVFNPADSQESVIVPRRFCDSSRFFAIRAVGDSMEPNIHSGDYAIVATDVLPDSGGLALVRINDSYEYMIKKVSYSSMKSTVDIISLNPNYPTRTEKLSDVTLQKVVHIIHQA